MSKRCELQKEYYQSNGNYKGNGKYCDKYVRWLEEQILALRIHDVVEQSEQLCPNCGSDNLETADNENDNLCNYCGWIWA
jgi:hypothetical protein